MEKHKRLKERHKKDQARTQELAAIVQQQHEMIQTPRLQVEELRQIVFGQRKKKKVKDKDDDGNPPLGGTLCSRSKDSYQRPIP